MSFRIIPVLLLKQSGLVKGVKFKNHKYIGDPINAVKIFSEKKADELIFLDITATRENRLPSLNLVQRVADECYMPFCIGGGIRSLNDAQTLFKEGAEKISINTAALENPTLIRDIADQFGSQSVVVSIDVKRTLFGYQRVVSASGRRMTSWDPVSWAKRAEAYGAGEILLTSIDRDGKMIGYDLELSKSISQAVSIPIISCGGAGNWGHFSEVVNEGSVHAAAAGSVFVFYKTRDAVLIRYPSPTEIRNITQL